MNHKVSHVNFKEAWSTGFMPNLAVLQAVWRWADTQGKTSRTSSIRFRVLLYYELYWLCLFFARPLSPWDRQLERFPLTVIFFTKEQISAKKTSYSAKKKPALCKKSRHSAKKSRHSAKKSRNSAKKSRALQKKSRPHQSYCKNNKKKKTTSF